MAHKTSLQEVRRGDKEGEQEHEKFKHKLGPTNKELNDRIDKNWLNMKKGARKEKQTRISTNLSGGIGEGKSKSG